MANTAIVRMTLFIGCLALLGGAGLLAAADGSPLGHLVQKSHGEVIAALLGLTFRAEWIDTSWHYPATSIDIPSSRHLQNAKEA